MNRHQQTALDTALSQKPFLQPLVTRLLAIGGKVTVVWNDDTTTTEGFVHCLLAVGRVTNGKGSRLRPMAASRCHSNAIRLARRYPKRYQREIGFALSKDGLWRSHSWLHDIRQNRIVETTERRSAYFGITMVGKTESHD
jgi:hypothetical protein